MTDALDRLDHQRTNLVIELVFGLIEHFGEDGDELGGQFEDCRVVVVIWVLLAFAVETGAGSEKWLGDLHSW